MSQIFVCSFIECIYCVYLSDWKLLSMLLQFNLKEIDKNYGLAVRHCINHSREHKYKYTASITNQHIVILSKTLIYILLAFIYHLRIQIKKQFLIVMVNILIYYSKNDKFDLFQVINKYICKHSCKILLNKRSCIQLLRMIAI